MNYRAPRSAEVARALESAARRIAPTIALIIALAVACYHGGRRCGLALHTLSDRLAAVWPSRPAPAPAAAPAAPAPIAAPVADPLTARVLLLRSRGISQRAIAAACGISRATVRRRLAMA
jgi:DNA-binding NarL/FixJ family response regulator